MLQLQFISFGAKNFLLLFYSLSVFYLSVKQPAGPQFLFKLPIHLFQLEIQAKNLKNTSISLPRGICSSQVEVVFIFLNLPQSYFYTSSFYGKLLLLQPFWPSWGFFPHMPQSCFTLKESFLRMLSYFFHIFLVVSLNGTFKWLKCALVFFVVVFLPAARFVVPLINRGYSHTIHFCAHQWLSFIDLKTISKTILIEPQ